MERDDKLRNEFFAALDVAPKTTAEMQAWAAVHTESAEWVTRVLMTLIAIDKSEGPGGMADALAQLLKRGYPVDWIVLLTRVIDAKVTGQTMLPYAIAALHKDLSLVLTACDAVREYCDGRMLAQLAQWLREANGVIAGFEYPTEELSKVVYNEAKAQRIKDMAREINELNLIERSFVEFANDSIEKDDLKGFIEAIESFSPDDLSTTFGLIYYGIIAKHQAGTLPRHWQYMQELARVWPAEMRRYLSGIVQAIKTPGEPHTEAICMMKWFLDGGVADKACEGDSQGFFELREQFRRAYEAYVKDHGDPEMRYKEWSE